MADRRKPGRPRLDPSDETVAVCLKLPAKDFDHYCRRALKRGQGVAEIIRADLRLVRRRDAPEPQTR